ncbi:MAG: hypothetical protein JWQ57_5090, partial [Mucilaginibacter sp.]|nr:hypothetical protein [Mucilaginibacter sp.]
MKKLMVLLLVLTCKISFAQNCSQFVNNVNGKKLTYISQDAKGKLQMTAVYVTT